MDEYIKLNGQTIGKDKIARLFQYSARALWYHMQKTNCNLYTVDKLKSLEYTLSTFRKLLRLGKSVEVLHTAFKSIHYQDAVLKFSCTMSKISNALFLLSDHVLWIGRSGLATIDTGKWSELANRYWLYSIFLNLIRDIYEIMKILENPNVRFKRSKNFYVTFFLGLGALIYKEHKDVFWDTVKNGCDIWIPLNALGYTKFSPGFIGILGAISSLAGLIAVIDPKAKLTPS